MRTDRECGGGSVGLSRETQSPVLSYIARVFLWRPMSTTDWFRPGVSKGNDKLMYWDWQCLN